MDRRDFAKVAAATVAAAVAAKVGVDAIEDEADAICIGHEGSMHRESGLDLNSKSTDVMHWVPASTVRIVGSPPPAAGWKERVVPEKGESKPEGSG